MANLKELRGRIKSVANIAQITRAMEMVASMKLRKVQAKAVTFYPYAQELRQMVERLAAKVGTESGLPWFRTDYPKTTGVLLITSDRGLCGAYNTNLMRALQDLGRELRAQDPDRKIKYWCYGRKGYTYLTRRGFDVERFFVDPPLDKLDFRAAKMIAQALAEAFLARTVDNVRIYYSHFVSVARFEPTNERFLPVMSRDFLTLPGAEGKQPAGSEAADPDFLMEPGATALFDRLMPRYLETMVFDAMVQGLASEHASRRMAMKGATDAAGRMTKSLKKIYNRARQENITKELLDIIGGVSAVS